MNETVELLMINKDAQERCSQWVENIKEDSLVTTESSGKRKQESESEDFIETDSEFDSVSECGAKRRKLGVKLKLEKYDLICEWVKCDFRSRSLDLFVNHVANHVTELDIRITDETEVYACLWSGCMYQSQVDVDIIRHVNYHAFHSKLKCLGTNVRSRTKLPKCQRDPDWKNILDTLPPHKCDWGDCNNKSFNNYQKFLYHTLTHAENNPRGNKVEGGINCLWKGCKGNYPSITKLREHMRVHTKEKIIACPNCGTMFANNTRFIDHCKRQIPLEVQGFQCSHCNKYYPTESILRDHMRNHIFHYKCDMCDMSCESPSGLAKHVLYRHSGSRSFACTLCSHAAKSQQDLDSHMSIHSVSNYACNFEGCSYSCKNAYTLDRHVEKVHRSEVRWYCCHECPMKYRKSYRLTKHLIETHHLQWLSGHKRFQYILEDDGCYRLQTVRYESIDEDIDVKDGVTFPAHEKNSKSSAQEKASVDNNEDSAQIVSTIPNILISIDEIDEHGNIINTKIIETQETSELPPSAEPPIILT